MESVMKARQQRNRWQVQEAKAKFSEVVKRAMAGRPQVVTYRGEEAVVVVSAKMFRGRRQEGEAFKRALFGGPPIDTLDLERATDRSRKVDL
jgi:antitoxin Phd